jgi:hypothetical protein
VREEHPPSETSPGTIGTLRRALAEILDVALFLAVPISLWLWAPSDPWTWILIGIPAMLGCLVMAAVTKRILVPEGKRR